MRLFSAAFASIALTVGVASAEPKTFTLDKSHQQVMYEVNHLGFAPSRGIFRDVDGTLVLDDAKPEAGKVEITVQTASLDAFWDKRTEHLKSADFFNVAQFPTMKFVSTRVERTGDKTAKVTGDLTMNGVTKPITLDVVTSGVKTHPMNQKPTVGFAATGTIKRSDFGVSQFVPAVSDEVKLTIDAEFAAAAAAPAAEQPKAKSKAKR